MKVKLLRKIRKRFEILHYPDGTYWRDTWHPGPFTLLWDNNWEYGSSHSFESKDIAYKKLFNILLKWIEAEYKTSRKRRYTKCEKLWFKK